MINSSHIEIVLKTNVTKSEKKKSVVCRWFVQFLFEFF